MFAVAAVLTSLIVVSSAAAAAPRIELQRQFTFIGHNPLRPSAPAFVYLQFRSCDDGAGTLRIIIREKKTIADEVLAQSGRAVEKPQRRGCQTQWLKWYLAPRFYGVGWYVVNVKVRDDEGNISNTIGRAWFTAD